MDTVDNLPKLTEIVWCNHLRVIPSPLIMANGAQCYIPPQKVYLIIEEGKVKLVCPECWRAGINQTNMFFRESESH